MNIFAISGLINAITVSILGAFVYFKNKTSQINIKYALFCFCVAFWSYNYFLWQIARDAKTALFFTRSLMAGAIFIPICFLHFILILLDLVEQKKRILNLGYFIFTIFFILNFTPYFVKDVGPKLLFPFWPEAGIAFGPFLVTWIWYCLYPCLLLYKGYRQSSGVKRNQLKYVLLAIVIGYSSGSTNYFLWYGIPIAPYGNFIVPIFVGIMAYAIVAHRLMDINVIITKGLAYATLTGVIAGVYVGLMAGMDRVFGGVAGYNPTLVHALLFVIVFFALIYVLPQMKIRALELTRRTLFRGKYDYQEELSEAARVIPTMFNLKRLGDYLLTKIRDTMMVDKLTLFVYDDTDHIYRHSSSLGIDREAISKIKFGENSPLAGLLRQSTGPLVKEELERQGMVPEEAMNLAIAHLNSLGAELCIPLMIKDDLTGIITLSNKKTGEMYTEEDLTLLTTLANQVALTIEYIRAIDTIASEKRYVGLGKAAMRMAHDIKNPLVPLKTFLQILPDKYPHEFEEMSKIDKEFTGRFYESALDGVDRINNLIERALHYSRHPEPHFSEVKLGEVLDDVLTQEDVDLKKTKVQLEKQYDPSSNSLQADGEQLIELFSNIIANSVDAMEESPSRRLILKTQTLNDRIAIEITDSGCGIPDDRLATIFDPFITYKHQGSGLGLAIAKKIVDDHKGTIEVSSKPGKGTSFKIVLPRKQQKG